MTFLHVGPHTRVRAYGRMNGQYFDTHGEYAAVSQALRGQSTQKAGVTQEIVGTPRDVILRLYGGSQ